MLKAACDSFYDYKELISMHTFIQYVGSFITSHACCGWALVFSKQWSLAGIK